MSSVIKEDRVAFSGVRSWWTTRSLWEKITVVVWTAVLLAICARAAVWPERRTVYPIFSGSAQLWWCGSDLYEPDRPKHVQGGYRYSPTFAILFTPLALFPDALGGVFWRLISTLSLLGALAWLALRVLPQAVSRRDFALLALLCLPLTVQSLNNGQANILVIAAMMAAVAAAKSERWNLASVLMSLAFVCKIYPLALGMLLILLYPRPLCWRMPLAIVLGLLAPFACQEPGYVVDQYEKWFALLWADDRTNTEPANKHRDLWLLIDIYALPIGRRFYSIMQVLGGVGVALLCWRRQRSGWLERDLLTSTLALAVGWILLLGPVVESSTFALLAPSLAWSILAAMQTGWRRRDWLLAGSVTLFLLAALLGGIANTADLHISGIHPWACLLYFIYLLFEARPSQQASGVEYFHRAAA